MKNTYPIILMLGVVALIACTKDKAGTDTTGNGQKYIIDTTWMGDNRLPPTIKERAILYKASYQDRRIGFLFTDSGYKMQIGILAPGQQYKNISTSFYRTQNLDSIAAGASVFVFGDSLTMHHCTGIELAVFGSDITQPVFSYTEQRLKETIPPELVQRIQTYVYMHQLYGYAFDFKDGYFDLGFLLTINEWAPETTAQVTAYNNELKELYENAKAEIFVDQPYRCKNVYYTTRYLDKTVTQPFPLAF